MLQVRDLSVGFADAAGSLIRAADQVAFDVMPSQALGLVGESGCGKSVTLRSLLGLQHPGAILGGTAHFDGVDILALDRRAQQRLRGSQIGMVFQDAASALNPLMSIGAQLTEVLRVKRGMSRGAAGREALALLERVGIPSAARRLRDHPHQLSGGLRQRVMIALALAPKPRLLLADEPTTALDVTIQDQVLALLSELRREAAMAMVLVSHDLSVVAQECDAVAVMYAGRIVEYGAVDEILDSPRHPYTERLMASTLPRDPVVERTPLRAIKGQPPELTSLPTGCTFRTRCEYAEERCASVAMDLVPELPAHSTACVMPERVGA